jgi:dCMP deaminase
MVNQNSLDEAYMGCARSMARMSWAERKKVGAILVSGGDEHGIIAEGWNGTPRGFDNVCEVGDLHEVDVRDGTSCKWCKDPTTRFCGRMVTLPEVLHAESNAIAKVAKSTNSSRGGTLYVTLSPCFECSKLIIQAGIKRVVYEEAYRLTEGIDLLKKAGIEVSQHEVV